MTLCDLFNYFNQFERRNAGIAMLPQLVKEISNENIKSASALEIDLKELIETIRDSKL